ncbi:hypothetical protein [Streptomyces sp. NPDC001435]|uniref:hypothetical protein n=1 Tax=unclassified Streptomyces TaxID=2593676 RepID=UPI00368F8AF8
MAIGADGDLEIRRGDMTQILYDAVRDSVAFEFNDSIATLDDRHDGIEVTFRSGARLTFDVVIGADGLHSNTRRLILGPEERFHHYLGACFAGFTLPNYLGLASEGLLWNTPGRSAALYAVGSGQNVFGLLTFRCSDPPFDAFRNPDAQRELLTATFGHHARRRAQGRPEGRRRPGQVRQARDVYGRPRGRRRVAYRRRPEDAAQAADGGGLLPL